MLILFPTSRLLVTGFLLTTFYCFIAHLLCSKQLARKYRVGHGPAGHSGK